MVRTLIILLTLISISFSQQDRIGSITWLRNFDDAKREAFFQTKLILIYFEKGSIEEGFKMETETWNQPAIIELSKRFVCLRADMQQWKSLQDQYERLRRMFRVDVVPTIIVTDPIGNEFYRCRGFIRGSDLQEVLKVLPRNLFNVYQSIKDMEANPNSISAKINAGIAYHRIRVAHISNKLLEGALKSDSVKSNDQMKENIETYRAINYYLLGELQKSIDLFEQLLDRFPNGEKQPVHLFYLVKLYLQDFKEDQAKKYLNMMQKRFPDNPYIKQAEDLFVK